MSCLQKLSVNQINKSRENFSRDNPTYGMQRQYILNWLDENQPTEGEFTYRVSGIDVCWSAWIKTLGITQRRFFALKREFLMGRRTGEHGNFFVSRECPQSEAAKAFLEQYFSENCDYMPNSSVWHLTSSSRKIEVYEEFGELMRATGKTVCSQALFRRIWKTQFSHVKIPKVISTFRLITVAFSPVITSGLLTFQLNTAANLCYNCKHYGRYLFLFRLTLTASIHCYPKILQRAAPVCCKEDSLSSLARSETRESAYVICLVRGNSSRLQRVFSHSRIWFVCWLYCSFKAKDISLVM